MKKASSGLIISLTVACLPHGNTVKEAEMEIMSPHHYPVFFLKGDIDIHGILACEKTPPVHASDTLLKFSYHTAGARIDFEYHFSNILIKVNVIARMPTHHDATRLFTILMEKFTERIGIPEHATSEEASWSTINGHAIQLLHNEKEVELHIEFMAKNI